jgi:hypothetical protein
MGSPKNTASIRAENKKSLWQFEIPDREEFSANAYRAEDAAPQDGIVLAAFDFNPTLYHTYDKVNALLLLRSDEYDGDPKPNITRSYVIGQTQEGRDLYAIKISDNPAVNEPGEKEILYIGSHHAIELVGVEITLALMDEFLAKYEANDPVIKAIVDASEIWIVPLLNPDGHVKVEQGLDWRKNTKLYPGQDEFNKGVDLNRNYGFRWNDCGITPIEKTTKCRVRTDPTSGSYIGPGPFSEAETQAIRDLVNDTAKVDGFTFSLSWHSAGGEILYPWGYTENAPYRHEQDKERFETGARILQDAIAQARDARGEPAEGYDILHPFRFLTAGTSDDWYYGEKGIFAYTIEAYGEEEGNPEPPNGVFNPPTQDILDRVISNNIAAGLTLATYEFSYRSYLPTMERYPE